MYRQSLFNPKDKLSERKQDEDDRLQLIQKEKEKEQERLQQEKEYNEHYIHGIEEYDENAQEIDIEDLLKCMMLLPELKNNEYIKKRVLSYFNEMAKEDKKNY